MLCLLSVAFIAAFHVPAVKVVDRTTGPAEAIQAAALGSASPIETKVNYDHCHVCGVVVPAAALTGHLVKLTLQLSGQGPLAAINPKTARPPPRH